MGRIELAFIFLLFGLGFFWGAIQLKRGMMKTGFLPQPINFQAPRDWVYGLWPTSIASLLTSIGLFFNSRILALFGLMGLIPATFIFMAWKPRWIQPDWLLWLRDNYTPSMVDFMLPQARRDSFWEASISTQEGLEAWAAEMAEEYQQQRRRTYG